MENWLRECNDNFVAPPRKLSLKDRLGYLRVPKPMWVRIPPSDGLRTLFRNLPLLLQDGIAVWGWVVQANSELCEEGRYNLPAEIVYSIAELDSAGHVYLQQLKHELIALKGTKPDDPELLSIAEYLTSETQRVFGLPVPSSISSKLRCHISTTLLVRKHLPNRMLWAPLLPVLVDPREPHIVIPLPERYWPNDFVEWWLHSSFPFDKALEEFSGNEEVAKLIQICSKADLEIQSHMRLGNFATAAIHRDRKVEHTHKLQSVLENYWNAEHDK